MSGMLTPINPIHSEELKAAKLRRRDWILLPLFGLVTICALAGISELIARRLFAQSTTTGGDLILNDPVTGPRGRPNSTSAQKIPEGELTNYRFNSSGFRDDVPFGEKQAGVYRIVMVGSSVAAGWQVPREKTFAKLLPQEIAQRSGRKIELYNEGLPSRYPYEIDHYFNDVLMVKPDLILWVVTPVDIERTPRDREDQPSSPFFAKVWLSVKEAYAARSIDPLMARIFDHARSSIMLKHILYESQNAYVKSSVISSDDQVGFLKSEPSPQWKGRMEKFDEEAAAIEEKARKADIPIVVALVPDRTQVAMISMTEDCPGGFDPYRLGSELDSIIVSHGGDYIDILPDFRALPNPHLGYFAVDGHPNSMGHATIARLLADKLTGGVVAPLRAQAHSQIGTGRVPIPSL